MKRILLTLVVTGLALTILPSLLMFLGTLDHEWAKHLMTAGMVVWLLGALPLAVIRRRRDS